MTDAVRCHLISLTHSFAARSTTRPVAPAPSTRGSDRRGDTSGGRCGSNVSTHPVTQAEPVVTSVCSHLRSVMLRPAAGAAPPAGGSVLLLGLNGEDVHDGIIGGRAGRWGSEYQFVAAAQGMGDESRADTGMGYACKKMRPESVHARLSLTTRPAGPARPRPGHRSGQRRGKTILGLEVCSGAGFQARRLPLWSGPSSATGVRWRGNCIVLRAYALF